MSGRPIAAAPYVFAEFIRIPHTDHVRTPHDGFSCEHQADRTKSRHRRRCPLSRSRRSAREGTWGRRNAPRSHNTGSFIFRRRVFANPSSSVAQTVEEPFCLIDSLCHKTGVVLYWSFMVPDINSRRFSFFPSFHAKRRKAGVTGRQRPCAGSGGESLRAQKRARSGGEEAASRRAERMRHVRAADRRCTVCFRGVYSHTAHRPCPHPA